MNCVLLTGRDSSGTGLALLEELDTLTTKWYSYLECSCGSTNLQSSTMLLSIFLLEEMI